MPELSQIAFSVSSLERSLGWYERVFGMRRSGSTGLFRGPVMERITGIPGPVSRCAWMVDCQRRFQLELFEFTRPTPRRQRGREASDVGYSTIAVSVADLERSLAAAASAGWEEPRLERGAGVERAFLRDPDGNRWALSEEDPREPGRSRARTGAASAVRGIRVSVHDVERSRRFFGGALGLREAGGDPLATGAERCLAYWANDLLIELTSDPDVAPWPPDYRLSDIGVLNVAFAAPSAAAFSRLCERVARAGYQLASRPARLGLGSVVYVTDDQGFSVELVHLSGVAARRLGYLE